MPGELAVVQCKDPYGSFTRCCKNAGPPFIAQWCGSQPDLGKIVIIEGYPFQVIRRATREECIAFADRAGVQPPFRDCPNYYELATD